MLLSFQDCCLWMALSFSFQLCPYRSLLSSCCIAINPQHLQARRDDSVLSRALMYDQAELKLQRQPCWLCRPKAWDRKLRDSTGHLLHKWATFDLEKSMFAFISFLLDFTGCHTITELLCVQYVLLKCSLFGKLSRAFIEGLEALWLLYTMNFLLFLLVL